MSSVSVIIPCYNYGRFLRDCVSSVLAQRGVDLEVLVIDDASTDETPLACAELAAQHPQLEMRRHEHNIGNIATFNEGLRRARGDYIVLISADDLLIPGALARAAALLDVRPDVGLVYGGAIRFADGQPCPVPRVPDAPVWEVRPGADWIEARCQVPVSPIVSPEAVVRASLQHELGGYRPELPASGDLEMWLRVAAHSAVARLPDADQAYHRFHPASMGRTRFATPISHLEQRKAAFDAFFSDHGRRLPNAERLGRMARRRLAGEALRLILAAYAHGRPSEAQTAELWAFALDCLREDGDARRAVLGRRAALGSRAIAASSAGWPRGRLISLYARRGPMRAAVDPALRVLKAGPAWERAVK